jgi:hypothetical protein
MVFMRASLCAAVFAFAAGGSSSAQASPAPAPLRAPLSPPFAQLGWLVGDWDCVATGPSGGTDRRLGIHNHITLAAGGEALDFGTTIDARGRTADDIMGYDPKNHTWYEHALVDRSNRQEFHGGAGALTKRSLVLLGVIEYLGHSVHVRSTYLWSPPNAYRFEGAALTPGGVWQTAELHSCRRSPGPTT